MSPVRKDDQHFDQQWKSSWHILNFYQDNFLVVREMMFPLWKLSKRKKEINDLDTEGLVSHFTVTEP